jgi:predicted RNA-binding protein
MPYWLCITNEENWKVIKEKTSGAFLKDMKTPSQKSNPEISF